MKRVLTAAAVATVAFAAGPVHAACVGGTGGSFGSCTSITIPTAHICEPPSTVGPVAAGHRARPRPGCCIVIGEQGQKPIVDDCV